MNIKEKLKQALIDMWPDELYHDFVTGIFLYLKTEELQQILLEEIISGEIDNSTFPPKKSAVQPIIKGKLLI